MNYFVRFNDNANRVYAIHSFNENIRAAERELSIQLKVSDPAEGDVLTNELHFLLEENSISKMEVLNENEVVIFASSLYAQAASLDVSLNLNFDLEDEDNSETWELLKATMVCPNKTMVMI